MEEPMPRKMPFKFQKNKNDPWGVKSHQKFYNSGVWRKLRAAFIQLNPICVQCEKNDLVVIADVVDHIVPLRKGGSALDEKNLQALCHVCHNKKSSSERN
jgi:5-methylcytosine-specific restriction enzyme A